jgi:hypothetical protein
LSGSKAQEQYWMDSKIDGWINGWTLEGRMSISLFLVSKLSLQGALSEFLPWHFNLLKFAKGRNSLWKGFWVGCHQTNTF